MKRNLFLCCAAVVMCLLAAPCLRAQEDQQSLADVVRQKSGIKAKRVVTNDEIPPVPEANLVPESGKTAPGGSGKAATATSGTTDATKANLPADKPPKLQALMTENDSLQKIIKQTQEKIDATNDPGRIGALSEIVKQAKDTIAENQSEIDKFKTGAAASSPTVQPGAPGSN